MSSVEKEVTQKNIELTRNHSEFAKRFEHERKYLMLAPELFEDLKQTANPIEQIYLSEQNDEFSLRVREEYTPDGPLYTATLKDRGEVEAGVRKRLEIETPISARAYEFFAHKPELPRVKKLRAHYNEATVIDFVEGVSGAIVEIEGAPDGSLVEAFPEKSSRLFVDLTGDTTFDNESLAFELSNVESGKEKESLDDFAHRVEKEMVAHYAAGRKQVVVGLTGMSGSGKTTVTKMIQESLAETFGEAYRPIVLSTDDYHRGKKWLEETYGAPWTEWDDPRVYNTEALAFDLENLEKGFPLLRRHFDFDKEEVVFDEEVQPTPFVIVEGLYAGSKDLAAVRTLHYELPTGIATSVGRDVRRLVIENRVNRVFPTPESRLKYQIETALPLYLSQERPRHNSFNASMRSMAERAFMLEKLEAHEA